MLRTSGFTDDVMFPYHGTNGHRIIKHDVVLRRVRQVAIPVGGRQTTISAG